MTTLLAAPRVSLEPPFSFSRGQEATELAATAGLVLDEHQSFVIGVMLAFREDGKFAAFEVGVVEPRQNGKGGILETRELAGVEILGEQLLIHSAHEYATALEAFYRMTALVETAGIQIRRVRNAHGEQGIDFMNGCRIRYRTRTRGGGRGFSCDFLGLDEAMFLPEFAHSALLPTMSARPNPQVAYTASAVDQEVHEHGIVLARVRERGKAGDDDSLAYFEWSLDYDHPDDVPAEVMEDPDAWSAANPALGLRISSEHVARELRSLSRRNFAVERLGVGDWPDPDDGSGSIISLEAWASLVDRKSTVLNPVCLAFDTSPKRTWSTIAAVGRRSDGRFHLEVIDQRRGTDWVPARLAELKAKHSPASIVCDGVGPAASLVKQIEHLGVTVKDLNTHDYARACGIFFDAVEAKKVRHLGTADLTAAIKGAATRPLGDAWAWSRKNSNVDITPLVAVTLALGEASDPPEPVYRAVGYS